MIFKKYFTESVFKPFNIPKSINLLMSICMEKPSNENFITESFKITLIS